MPHPDASAHPLLILGMHRSGTSYLANLLNSFGVHIGKDLVGPEKGNPRGHFEEKSLVEFHQKLIGARISEHRRAFDDGMLVQEAFDGNYTAEERAEARKIVEDLQQPGWWGWKEPRTCLFIDLWREILPDLRSIVVYRHPLEVHYSLLRREHWDLALFPDQAMHAYVIYNRPLLALGKTGNENVFIFNGNAGYGQLDSLAERLSEFISLPVPGKMPEFYAKEFHGLRISKTAHRLFGLLYPEAAKSFDQIQSLSSIPYVFHDREDDVELEDVFNCLHPLLKDAAPEVRAIFGPYLDSVILRKENLDTPNLYTRLAEEVGAHIRRVEAWNQAANKIYEDNQQLHEENKRLGADYKKQQAFLAKQKATHNKIWGELQRTGKSWKEQREIIQKLMAENETLKKKLAEKAEAGPSAES